jgi:hypothetical protein
VKLAKVKNSAVRDLVEEVVVCTWRGGLKGEEGADEAEARVVSQPTSALW